MKTIDMERAFATIPELPEDFRERCFSMIAKVPIYYKRKGKRANCLCGKCANEYETEEVPVRHMRATCKVCGNTGVWEWMRTTRPISGCDDVTLVQCTTDQNIVLRVFRITHGYRQYQSAYISMDERRRYFLHMGDAYVFYNTFAQYDRVKKVEVRVWGRKNDCGSMCIENLYPGFERELKKSKLKYCDPSAISAGITGDYARAMITYANNPAIEMYAKAGMESLVRHLLFKKGKTKLINRRAKTLFGQLRIKDKDALNRLVKNNGNIALLKILQAEKKQKLRLNDEQTEFVLRVMKVIHGEEKLQFLTRYMTLQKLMNRTRKYLEQGEYRNEHAVVGAYYDYLQMRLELGYDLSNELYVYPKNLKEKHDQMVTERLARRDEQHIAKMKIAYPKIEEKYKRLSKKYSYEKDGMIIRPAKDAGEIVMEGRILHHCVGRQWYLEKHNKGNSFILFLRRTSAPDEPYYTIEIRGSEIVQWYGIKDTKPDKEIIEPWLKEYTEHLSAGKKDADAASELVRAAG